MKYFPILLFLIILHGSPLWAEETSTYDSCLQKAYQAQSLYQVEEAERWFRKALEINDSDTTIKLALARTLFAQLKNQEGLEVVQNVLKEQPTHSDAHYFLCRYYWLVAKDIDKAEHHGQLAAKYDAQNLNAKLLLGEIYISQQKFNEAETLYQQLIKMDEPSIEAYVGLGNTLIKQEKYDQGIQTLQQAIKIDEKNPDPHRILAIAYAKKGNRDRAKEAQKTYQTLKTNLHRIDNLLRDLHANPENAQQWFDLGKEYLRQRYPTDKAIEAIKKGLYFDKENADMHNLLGTLYLNTNQTTLAKDHLLFSISINPDNPKFYNNLGVACLLNEDYEEAVNYLNKSLDLGNDDPGVIRNLEFAKMKLKEISKK